MVQRVLEGIRVLDASIFRAGPICAQILADWGADVIRMEMPGGNVDREVPPLLSNEKSYYLAFTCRNKKGITLNLGKEEGREIFQRLVKQVDIAIESFGPVVNKKLAIDYQSLREIKQDIIVVAISAFGQYGPYASRVGFDAIAQAMSGIMWITGFPDENRPVRAGVNFVDNVTGLYGALGALLALRHRDNTGKGQLVDVSLLDTAMSFPDATMGNYKIMNCIQPQVGNANVFAAPYDAFKAKDGWVFIGALTRSQWTALCKTTGKVELIDDPRFKTLADRAREEHRQFFNEWLSQWVAERKVNEIVDQLNNADVPCSPVNTIAEAVSDPQVRAREIIVDLDHPGIGKVPVLRTPIKLSESPGEIRTPAPAVGEHNKEVYSSLLGLDSEQLSRLMQEGII